VAFWSVTGELHRRMFVGDIHGGTLLFRRSLLDEGIRYPEVNLAEDAGLVHQIAHRRRRILRMENPGLFVYVRHGQNTWKFETGRFIDPKGWRAVPIPPEFAGLTMEQYRAACP
jgi:hypothetical protein